MYTYKKLMQDISYLKHKYASIGSIGLSSDGRKIPYIYVGNSHTNTVIVTGGIHAREHISSYVVIKQAFYALNHYSDICAIDAGIYFVPMLNPDGNEIISLGETAVKNIDNTIIKNILSKPSFDKRMLKSNANGVDLNTNFDANWGSGEDNISTPASQNFIGKNAFSECESRSLARFTQKILPKATVSYHCKGREIYYEFFQNKHDRTRDRAIAEIINNKLGYKIVDGDLNSSGGYKDWCVQKLKIPAFTIELVDDKYSHPIDNYNCAKNDIIANLDLPIILLKAIN